MKVHKYYQRRVSSSGSMSAAGPASRMDDAYHMRLPKWVPREHYSRLRYPDHMLQCSHPPVLSLVHDGLEGVPGLAT